MYKIRETSQCYNKFTHDRVIVDHNNIEKRRRIGIPCSLRIGKSKKSKWLNNRKKGRLNRRRDSIGCKCQFVREKQKIRLSSKFFNLRLFSRTVELLNKVLGLNIRRDIDGFIFLFSVKIITVKMLPGLSIGFACWYSL